MTTLLSDSKPTASYSVNQELAGLLGQLQVGGVEAALRFLNGRVAHRFTAVFKFQGDMQRAVFVYDKLGQSPDSLNAMPIVDTFSQPTMAPGPFTAFNAFTAENAASNGFPGRRKPCPVVRSYYGVLLSQAGGRAAGSLCHLDFDAQAMPAPEECVFLDRAKCLLLTRLNGFQS
jgi:hypothetical protein